MTPMKEQQLARIRKQFHSLKVREESATGWGRRSIVVRKFLGVIRHELVRNDVALQAQALSFFTLFSILPLLAGMFLVLGFFSQWGPVQKEFEEILRSLLSSIPEDQRKTLFEFLIAFRNRYLSDLHRKGGSLGIFAFSVLIWIGARVYLNIEALMNRIWSVRSKGHWILRIRNFILVTGFAPVFCVVAVSLPPLFAGISVLLVFGVLVALLRFVPNARVGWTSAFGGALAGAVGFELTNLLLGVYFRFGTHSAYGKVAVLPIFGLFIYAAWLIFIFAVMTSRMIEQGAEVLGTGASRSGTATES